MYYLFSKEEFQERLEKCRKEMERNSFDVLILTNTGNITYMSGYRTQLFHSSLRPFICIITKDKLPALIVPNLERGAAEKETWFDDIRIYGPACDTKDPLSSIQDYLNKNNLNKGKVGIELDDAMRPGLTPVELKKLYEILEGNSVESCSSLMWRLRQVKSEKEIEYLAEACRISDAGYNAVLEKAEAGMTERDLQKIMGSTFLLEGGEIAGSIIIASGPERYNMMNPKPSYRKLCHGDMVLFDFGAYFNGYRADITREFFIGSISPRQKELYEAELAVQKAALDAIEPGKEIGKIDVAAINKAKELGYKDLLLHRSGHSLGIEGHESPSVAETEKTKLQPGMCLSIEPGLYDFSVGAFRMEDNIVITENGYEYLSHSPREIIIK